MHRSKRKSWQECKRIRKLLASEYYEFSETILVESSFAETSRNGRGIRQVTLGLTPDSLIVAGDILKRDPGFFCPRNLDPSIETFELISIYPLEYVNLSIFRRRRQKTLKVRFIDGRVKYYEFGGSRQTKSWKIWCERVEKLLSRRIEGSSLSESTAASSSSTSTLYLLPSELELRTFKGRRSRKTMLRVWNRFEGPSRISSPSWTQRNLYLGPSYQELFDGHYKPVPIKFADASLQGIREELANYSPSKTSNTKPSQSWPIYENLTTSPSQCLCNVLFHADWEYNRCEYCAFPHVSPTLFLDQKDMEHPIDKKTLTRKVSRFGVGVTEKCNSALVLGPCRRDSSYQNVLRCQAVDDFHALMESSVSLWEWNSRQREKSSKHRRHVRRYGLAASAHFHRALGPWSIQPGERHCIESQRSMSVVTIRRQPCDPELKLPVSRRQLATSASCTSLQPDSSIGSSGGGKVILFWTPDYWYRPRHAIDAYRQLRKHLEDLREFRQQKEQQPTRKLFNGRKKNSRFESKKSETAVEERASSLLGRILTGNLRNGRKRVEENEGNNTTDHLRRLLRMDLRITIWDLDSTLLATQLTLIDRDLFTRIPAEEMRILAYRKTCASAPNFGAWIAFAHRISCLTTSEVLSIRNLEMRARIVSRFINAANKCFIMGNFQSCRSILAGLQAPAIYRLKNTWSHVRIHHATRYEMMEKYCKIFKNTCAVAYRRAWAKAERTPPHLPYVGDVLMRVSEVREEGNPSDYSEFSQEQSHQQAQWTKPESQTLLVPAVKESSPRNDSFGKRILAMTLRRIPFRLKSKVVNDVDECRNLKVRQEDLARKYFHRWNNNVLKSKMRAREQERLRTMDSMTKRILDVASWLIDCQRISRGYDFPLHSIAHEFLLKARYREDRENFFVSLKLEPLRVT